MIEIYKWQALIGAFIGAGSPFLLWWFTEVIRRKKEYRKNLYYLIRLLNYQVNNATQAYAAIKNFIDNVLLKMIESVKDNETVFLIHDTSFPLFSFIPIEKNILEINTCSEDLDFRILACYKNSLDVALVIDQARNIFHAKIQRNIDMSLIESMSPAKLNNDYKNLLIFYKNELEKEVLKGNFQFYLKLLFTTQLILSEYSEMNKILWHLKFNPNFKFFIRKKDYKEAKKEEYNNIMNFYKEKIDKQFNECISELEK